MFDLTDSQVMGLVIVASFVFVLVVILVSRSRRSSRRWQARGVRAVGRVTQVDYLHYGEAGGQWTTFVEFTDADGRVHTIRTGGKWAGDVTILYDPDNPERVSIVEGESLLNPVWQNFKLILVFGCFGAVAVAGLMLLSGFWTIER